MEELTQHTKFYGDGNDNSIEFCGNMKGDDTIKNKLTDQDKINFIQNIAKG